MFTGGMHTRNLATPDSQQEVSANQIPMSSPLPDPVETEAAEPEETSAQSQVSPQGSPKLQMDKSDHNWNVETIYKDYQLLLGNQKGLPIQVQNMVGLKADQQRISHVFRASANSRDVQQFRRRSNA